MSERPTVIPKEVASQAAVAAGGELEHSNGSAQGEAISDSELPEPASLNHHNGVSGGELQLPEELAQKYDHLEARVVKTKNGPQRRIYGIGDNKDQLKANDVLAAYGYDSVKEELANTENAKTGLDRVGESVSGRIGDLKKQYEEKAHNAISAFAEDSSDTDNDRGLVDIPRALQALRNIDGVFSSENTESFWDVGQERSDAGNKTPDSSEQDEHGHKNHDHGAGDKAEQADSGEKDSKTDVNPEVPTEPTKKNMRERLKSIWGRARGSLASIRKAGLKGSVIAAHNSASYQTARTKEYFSDEEKGKRRQIVAGVVGAVVVAGGAYLATKGVPFTGSSAEKANELEHLAQEPLAQEPLTQDQLDYIEGGLKIEAAHPELSGQELVDRLENTSQYAAKVNELEQSGIPRAEIDEMARRWFEETENTLTQDQLNYIEGGLEVQEANPELSGQELAARLENTSNYAAKVNELRESGVPKAEIDEMARRWFEETENARLWSEESED